MSDLHRHDVSGELWDKMVLLRWPTRKVRKNAVENRFFIHAVLFVIWEGISSRSLPARCYRTVSPLAVMVGLMLIGLFWG